MAIFVGVPTRAAALSTAAKYQLTIAKPLAKDLDDFQFEGTPTNAALVEDLAAAASSPSNATRPFRLAPRWERAPCLS